MRGLAPRIHRGIEFHLMDCRVKPGNDDLPQNENAARNWAAF
jgi:hypothetical protein